MVWKNAGNETNQNSEKQNESLTEMKNKLEEELERNLRIEDQLWGVLDRVKEQEQYFKRFNKKLEDLKSSQNTDAEEKIEAWGIEILSFMKKNFNSLREHYEGLAANMTNTASDHSKEIEEEQYGSTAGNADVSESGNYGVQVEDIDLSDLGDVEPETGNYKMQPPSISINNIKIEGEEDDEEIEAEGGKNNDGDIGSEDEKKS
jgi:hypothetical protein